MKHERNLFKAPDAVVFTTLDFKLEKDVGFTVSKFGVSIFLNAYNDGPLNDTFYSLAMVMAIENEVTELLHS